MLQKKIDEQVLAAGLPEKMIKVAVGKYDTGVIGADDKNALEFYINPDIKLEPANYKIDGLKGSSLFEIFYKTEGDLIPAYITSTKDYTNGVEIESGKNEFSFDVDGTTYTYTIPEGSYTADEIADTLNQLILQPDNNGNTAPVHAEIEENRLRISHNLVGNHTVNNIQGTAKTALFYEMKGRTNYDSDSMLQIGANSGQSMVLERFSLSTLSMGINSIAISKRKNAEKALGRLDNALTYLNSCRSKYGARQNRLEYTIKGNNNTAENTQASESLDRDTDMAEEMVQYSKHQILQQAAMALLAQAKDQTGAVLRLLQ
jgi:flagellin